MTVHAARSDPLGPIALDVGAARHPVAGVGIYIEQLSRGLEALRPGAMVRVGIRSEGPLPPARRALGETELSGYGHLAWLQTRADRDVRAAGCRLVHYTNAAAPLRTRVPFVLTIQDLSLLRHPGQHPLARWASVPFLIAAARQARLVIVPSDATAREVRRLLHVGHERIAIIPLAARRHPNVPVELRHLESLGIEPGQFILSVGTIEPRKNHRRLLAAFERVAEDDTDLQLVLVGARGWRTSGFDRSLSRSPKRDRVIVLGRQSEEVLATLLATCAVMAYPSTYEGFGLPVVEAMAAGAPVVTSNVSALPEAAGGAAVLVDPYSVASIADGLADAMRRRDELARAGRARVRARDWSDVARETLEAYERTAAS